MEETLSEQKIQTIGARAERLARVKETEGWQELREEFERKQTRYFEKLAKDLIRGDVPEDLEYQRGFWAGAKWILDNPEKAIQSFESALKRARVLTEED